VEWLQGVGPEFKPQYHRNKQKNLEKLRKIFSEHSAGAHHEDLGRKGSGSPVKELGI
jgi:glutamine amidotransferase-like uncharacterized protein